MGVQLGEREDGLYLDEVMEGTPAEATGLESGDRILTLAGTAIDSREGLGAVLSEYAIGDTIDIVVERAERELHLSLTLGSRP